MSSALSVAAASLDEVDAPPRDTAYNEYDYCEVEGRDEPATPKTNQPSTNPSPHKEQDYQYLRYYAHHVNVICDNVKQYATRLQTVLAVGHSNQTLVSASKQLVASAHRLVYIGDTLSRSLREPVLQSAVSNDANMLCNALKDFIMCTKEAALAKQTARPAALTKLKDNISAVQFQTVSFQTVIANHTATNS